jgi:hypothetical protein
MRVIPVVHHPAYVLPPEPGQAPKPNKNGLIRDLLIAGDAAVEWV